MPQVAQGGTVRLSALYKNAAGELVDPLTPLLDVIDPNNAVVVNDAVPTRESIGSFFYDFSAAVDAPLGSWIARFTGVINGGTVVGDEPFTVLAPGAVGVGAPWLIQPSEYYTSQSIASGDITAPLSAQIQQAITFASEAVRNYLDRNIGDPLVTETRTYEYDGSGYLDIDDAASVTAAALSYGTVDLSLDTTQWRAQPYGRPVFTYLLLPVEGGRHPSPEMGFTQNLDILAREGRLGTLPTLAKVTGSFGWPDVPGPVKQATILTVQEFVAEDPEYDAEAIESYSRSRSTQGTRTAIPDRARELLAPYVREGS